MACRHKFYEYLTCTNINYKPRILIVGTFNPEWPTDNYADWFYGRTKNNYFWEVLPRMYNENSLRNSDQSSWKQFCIQKNIAITDLISSINDADIENPIHQNVISNFKDTEFSKTFNDFQMTNVIEILQNIPTIEKVYFTRNSGLSLFDNQINEIKLYCLNNQIYFSHLLTPSANARFQMRGWVPQLPNLERNLSNFIFEKWLFNWQS